MTSENKIKVGLVGLGRVQFDIEHAQREYNAAANLLNEINEAEPIIIQELATAPADAVAAAQNLKANGAEAVIVLLATFTDASLVTTLFSELNLPTLLWALPEPSIGNASRLRLNSLCGVNLAAYTLTSAGRKFEYVYGGAQSADTAATVTSWLKAVAVDKLMHNLRIGLVGSRPPGFYPSTYDELKLWREIGPQVQIYQLSEVFGAANAVPSSQTENVRGMLRKCLNNLDDLPEQVVCSSANSYTALTELAERDKLGALAVKCWPEFFTDYGSAACGVLAALSENGIIAACEADLHGAVTMVAMRYLSGQPPFLADLVSMDKQRDSIVLWHCGNAAFSLAAEPEQRQAGVHSNRKVGVTAMFPLKPGRVTLSRLSYSQGKYRLLLTKGEVLESELLFQGNTAEIRPDSGAAKLLDTIIYGGFEHHMVMAYGDIQNELEHWAKMINLEVEIV